MKRWALVTVLLYALVLVALTVPLLAFYELRFRDGQFHYDLSNGLDAYREWSYWLVLAVLMLCQAALLFVPVKIAQRRLKPRRHLLVPTLVTSLLLANLFFSGLMSGLVAVWGDDGGNWIEFLARRSQENIERVPGLGTALTNTGLLNTEWLAALNSLGILALLWLFWGFVFYRGTRQDTPENHVKRAARWLIHGSILEILVAVPSHLIVRAREDCCAPVATFWGITSGLAIMLLAFGPGVFFLFAARMRRSRPAPPVIPPVIPGQP